MKKYCTFCRAKLTYLWPKGQGRTQFFCERCLLMFEFRPFKTNQEGNGKMWTIKIWRTKRIPYTIYFKAPT